MDKDLIPVLIQRLTNRDRIGRRLGRRRAIRRAMAATVITLIWLAIFTGVLPFRNFPPLFALWCSLIFGLASIWSWTGIRWYDRHRAWNWPRLLESIEYCLELAPSITMADGRSMHLSPSHVCFCAQHRPDWPQRRTSSLYPPDRVPLIRPLPPASPPTPTGPTCANVDDASQGPRLWTWREPAAIHGAWPEWARLLAADPAAGQRRGLSTDSAVVAHVATGRGPSPDPAGDPESRRTRRRADVGNHWRRPAKGHACGHGGSRLPCTVPGLNGHVCSPGSLPLANVRA